MAAVGLQENPSSSKSSKTKIELKNPLIFNDELQQIIVKSKVLVVGAGGIGCELLKNLVLTGFQYIEIIDLDTIDVSNLNRQFLFQKKHVGKPKAEVAKESVLKYNPNAKIIAHHASVTGPEFGVGFIGKFDVVLNALDNRAARNHVNRLCLAAKIPLIESGTAGYNGQVELISKSFSKCYECEMRPPEKTYPGCTIRNTPSMLIHCIVWAKHLFNQLFGEQVPFEEDEDVSPDPTDIEAGGDTTNNKPRITTRNWAKEVEYAPDKLFTKLFQDDINYLLSLKRLWEKRRPPVPLKWNEVTSSSTGESSESSQNAAIPAQKIWSLSECAAVFAESLSGLKKDMENSNVGFLVWDKDYKSAMNFVASAANIRAHIFGIGTKSLFDIKSMAGNIVPAIATSNAIVAGLVVLKALNVLRSELEQCKTVYVRDNPSGRGEIIAREVVIVKPNPKCVVCSDKPQVIIATDLSKMKCKEFELSVLKEKLNMIAPDIQLDSTGSVIISSEEGETDHNNEKTLKELGISDGTILQADDFVQNYKLTIIVRQRKFERDEAPFLVISDISELKPKEEKENGKDESSSQNKSKPEGDPESDDELMIIDEDDDVEPKKRKNEEIPVPVKKRRTDDKSNVICIS